MIEADVVKNLLESRPDDQLMLIENMVTAMPDSPMSLLHDYVNRLEQVARAQLPTPNVPEPLVSAIIQALQANGDLLRIPMGTDLISPAIKIGQQVINAGWVKP